MIYVVSLFTRVPNVLRLYFVSVLAYGFHRVTVDSGGTAHAIHFSG